MAVTDAEQAAMHRALALAETVRGRTSPNPAVGAVILDPDGRLVGEGATAPAGGPHAEVVALGGRRRPRAGRHRGRHPRAVHPHRPHRPVRRGADRGRGRRVVYAVADPNPDAAGGADRLRDGRRRGRRRDRGSTRRPAARCGPGCTRVRPGRPFVTWKYAATLDGRSRPPTAPSQWITSAASRADVARLRADRRRDRRRQRHRAGRRPAADRPRRRRQLAERQPLRVVLDRRHRVHGPTARARESSTTPRRRWCSTPPRRGSRSRRCTTAGCGTSCSRAARRWPARSSRRGCVDEVVAYLAPMLLGAGPPALGRCGHRNTIADALTLDVESVSRLGDDVKLVSVGPHWAEQIEE